MVSVKLVEEIETNEGSCLSVGKECSVPNDADPLSR
jgi:hypothetical protein